MFLSAHAPHAKKNVSPPTTNCDCNNYVALMSLWEGGTTMITLLVSILN